MQASESTAFFFFLLKILGHHMPYFDLTDIQITSWNVKNSVNADVVYTCLIPNIWFDILDWIVRIDSLS
jgi:hypothetical protein